jgi:hydrogenase-4 membrane subunit HyfE
MASLSTSDIVFAWAVASSVAVAVFLHANKRGSKHATAWGIGVFLFLAIVLPVYVFHSWRSKPPGPQRRY